MPFTLRRPDRRSQPSAFSTRDGQKIHGKYLRKLILRLPKKEIKSNAILSKVESGLARRSGSLSRWRHHRMTDPVRHGKTVGAGQYDKLAVADGR
jgi:hypothetical protein